MTTNSRQNYDDSQYLRLRRSNRKLREEKKNLLVMSRLMMIIAIIAATITLTILGLSKFQTAKLNAEIEQLKAENSELAKVNKNLSGSYNEVAELSQNMSEISVTLDNENKKLKETCKQQDEDLIKFEERTELYDKYEYAIVRSNGSRTDITYDELKTLEDLTNEKNMSKDVVNLVLALAMTESNGKENAKNTASTATGFGGFLSGTGEFVYKELMGKDANYAHNKTAKDGETNLQMMVYYIDHLNDTCKGNINSIIDSYRGLHDDKYYTSLNKYLGYSGLSVSSIKINK